MKRNWPCNVNCSLCYCMPETTPHLLTECNFTEAVWNQLLIYLQRQGQIAQLNTDGI
ncbi:hypothetical protein PR202_ga24706 [Eleusine coracana subsp. coracana]|uniref:Reverse transcriptase zinc-binding domain-containing protein n=1 Tax=Eleusine coracana subsp. coracana TaxID=191504 RepID=A0AAV5D7H2_ELECO|nr:hypothetical protein PR202_ga24706 [Eleusine coracana subsp. coracana]